MIFNVCFDPAVIGAAAANGPYAMQALIALLRGLAANCILFDFEDTRLQRGFRSAVEALPQMSDRAEILRILGQLMKRIRFVAVMPDPDWTSIETDMQHAFRQAQACGVQLVVTDEQGIAGVSSASLADYQHTALERERFSRALNGRVFVRDEHNESEFLTLTFGKALRHARRIQIYDPILGRKFADNFEHTLRVLFRWMGTAFHDAVSCKITIHTKRSERDGHLCHMIREFHTRWLTPAIIEAVFYENSIGEHVLPHDRFIWTDQFAFDIGRGMDFLNRETLKNRDVSINLKSVSEVTTAMARCLNCNPRTEVL